MRPLSEGDVPFDVGLVVAAVRADDDGTAGDDGLGFAAVDDGRGRRDEGDQNGGGPYFFNPGSMAVARLRYFWAFLASPFCS